MYDRDPSTWEAYKDPSEKRERGENYPYVDSFDEAVDLARTTGAPVRCWIRGETQTGISTPTAVKAYPSGSYRFDRITDRSKQPRKGR